MEVIQGVMQDITGLPDADRTRIKRELGSPVNHQGAQLQSYSQSSDSQSGCSQPACTQEPRNQFAGGQELCGLHTLGVLNSDY